MTPDADRLCPECLAPRQHGPTIEILKWARDVGEQRALMKVTPIWRRDPVTVSFDGGRTWHSAPQ